MKQLATNSSPFDYETKGVDFEDRPHLKSAFTQVSDDALLINNRWVDADHFAGINLFRVDPSEPLGANPLHIGATVIYPAHFPKTRQRPEAGGVSMSIRSIFQS